MAKVVGSLQTSRAGHHGTILHGWKAGVGLALSGMAGLVFLLSSSRPFAVSPPSTIAALATARAHRVIAGGTVLRIHTQASQADLVLRTGNQNLSYVLVGSATALLSRDGRTLTPADIRLGDTVTQSADGHIEDRSQSWTDNLHGTVQAVSGPAGNPVIVRTNSSHTIVVDIGTGTRVTSQTPSTILADADQVTVSGMLDQALGEMTQTAAIVRLGP